MNALAERIKIARESLGKTQKEMATILDVSYGSLKVYESGKSVPGSEVIEALVKLGFNANWLLVGEEPMKRGEGLAYQPFDVSGRDRRSAEDDVIDKIDHAINKKITLYGDLQGIRGFAMATIIYKVYSNRFIESPEYRLESLETIVDCLFKLSTGKTTDQVMVKHLEYPHNDKQDTEG